MELRNLESQIRADQTRADQTRADQTRADQTRVDQTRADLQVANLAKRLLVVLAASRTVPTDCLRSDSGTTTKTLPRDVLDSA